MCSPNNYFVAAALFLNAQTATACDPIIAPAKEVLARRDLIFVVGQYSADGMFVVEDSLGGIVTPRAYHLFERGPFGSQCEIETMKVSAPSPRQVAGKIRFLLPVEKKNDKQQQLLVVMGYPYRLVVNLDNITDQYFGASSRLSDLRREILNAR